MHIDSKKLSIISLLSAAFLMFFMSCSQNLPEVTSTDYSVIFNYADEENPPEVSLSVFATSASDVRRYQEIKITSLDTGYCWESDMLIRLDDEQNQWVGCTNLVPPEDEKIPFGTYKLTYINADEKECSLILDVKYDVDFYEVLLPGLPELMSKKRAIEKIAIYDKEHILIYFGDRTEEFKTTRDIWNRYRDAAIYQIIWFTQNGNVICITPEKEVKPDAED